MCEESILGTDRLKHLEFIQQIVGRLGNNSFLVKGWALTLAAVFFAVLIGGLDGPVALAGLVPLAAFWSLDAYYLWQERMFRRLYDDARTLDSTVDLMSMNIGPYRRRLNWVKVVASRTLVLFYGSLMVVNLILVAAAVLI